MSLTKPFLLFSPFPSLSSSPDQPWSSHHCRWRAPTSCCICRGRSGQGGAAVFGACCLSLNQTASKCWGSTKGEVSYQNATILLFLADFDAAPFFHFDSHRSLLLKQLQLAFLDNTWAISSSLGLTSISISSSHDQQHLPLFFSIINQQHHQLVISCCCCCFSG